MHPIVEVQVGSLHLITSSYRFFMVLAALATIGLGFALALLQGLPWRRTLVCLLLMAAATPLGARLLDAATKPDAYVQEPGLLLQTDLVGFSLFGGLLLAALVGSVTCHYLRLDLRRLADSVAPSLGVGIASMRWGCYQAGCCFGRETDLPWGVTFPVGSEAHLYQMLHGGRLFALSGPVPVHPTQLYEMVAALAGAAVALWLLRRRASAGVTFLVATAWYAAFRLLNHGLRAPSYALDIPDWFYPALYAAVLLVAVSGLLATLRREHRVAVFGATETLGRSRADPT